MKKLTAVLLVILLTTAVSGARVLAFATPLGDVDGDRIVTPADARLALRASVRLEYYAGATAAFAAADADQDGAITAEDARMILRASIGADRLKADGPSITELIDHNAEAWKDYDDPGLFTAYYEQVMQLTGLCGEGQITDTPYAGKCLDKLSVVRLIDLDRDGQPELYCAYSDNEKLTRNTNRQAVYSYRNNKVETLFDGPITNRGSDFSPLVWFHENAGTIHFVAGWLFDRLYYTYEDGILREVRVNDEGFGYAYVNGELCPADRYQALLDQYVNQGAAAKINIFDLSEHAADNYNAVLHETQAVISLLRNSVKNTVDD